MEFPEYIDGGPARLLVVSVGGGGGSALNEMIRRQLYGVGYLAVDTDSAALEANHAERKMLIGEKILGGLGAGADPRKGREAALADSGRIEAAFSGVDMVVLVAGMGGGTGTGAAPVIAAIARNCGALAVGVAGLPFTFEGTRRAGAAREGLTEMLACADSVVAIPCARLARILRYPRRARRSHEPAFRQLLARVDRTLHAAVRGLTDLVTVDGLVGIDFADIRYVMQRGAGLAMMGEGRGTGASRARDAAMKAVNSPFFDCASLGDARGALLRLAAGPDYSIEELAEVSGIIQDRLHEDAALFFQIVPDESLGAAMHVTLIATGMPCRMPFFSEPGRAADEDAVFHFTEDAE